MDWSRERYRKLYIREIGSFQQLPLYARALAGELLKIADDDGKIALGGKSPAEAIAFAVGANKQDRALLRIHVPMLLKDRYIVQEDDAIRIRNFTAAQSTRSVSNQESKEALPSDLRKTSGGLPSDFRLTSGEDDTPKSTESFDSKCVQEKIREDKNTEPPLPPVESSTVDPQPSAGAPPATPAIEDNPKSSTERGKATVRTTEKVRDVFTHWQQVMNTPRSALDAKRARIIHNAIERHSLEDCKRAIDGCFQSDFHMNREGGGNQTSKKYNTISLILRDSEHVEQFLQVIDGNIETEQARRQEQARIEARANEPWTPDKIHPKFRKLLDQGTV